jgi:GNAT superfamily N-acetyltransferase
MRIAEICKLPEDFKQLAAEASAEGHGFLSKMQAEWISSKNCFDLENEILYEVRSEEGILIGIGGLNVDPYVSDPEIGRVRHVFIARNFRGAGIGKALVGKIVGYAQGKFGLLRLSTQNPKAVTLYESFGFEVDAEGLASGRTLMRMVLSSE